MATTSTSTAVAEAQAIQEINPNMSIDSNPSELSNLSASIDLVQSEEVTLNTSIDSINCEEINPNVSMESNRSEVTNSSASTDLVQSNASTSSMIPSEPTTSKSKTDISYYVKESCTDEEKYRIMKNQWIPNENFTFPTSEYRNLKFQRKWLTEFRWLSYSVRDDGAYCRFCVFFCNDEVGKGRHVKVNALVNSPYKNWKKAIEQFKKHQNLEYHKTATVFAQNFIDLIDKKKSDISIQLDKSRKNEIEMNRKIVSSIIETIILIGRQDIACRGHRDCGPIKIEMPEENDGNFRSLLRFRISSGDVNLQKHLENTKTRYTSPLIQNEIINICGNVILDKIMTKAIDSKYFSIMADETTDVSGIEQFSFAIRYVDKTVEKKCLREDFLTFVDVHDVTGEGLSNTVIKLCKEFNLDMKYLVGQGYDGGSAMSAKFKGCAARLTSIFPQAIYVHCMNHVLNLSLGHSCNVLIIRNALGTMNEVITFFRSSSKRQDSLNETIASMEDGPKKKRLTKYCETRWVERLDAIVAFHDLFLTIFIALDKIQENGNQETAQKAFILQQALKNSGFIVSMVVIREIFSLTQPLSTYLQAKHVDIASAVEMCQNLINLLKKMREKSTEKFKELFDESTKIATTIGEELKKPRLVQKQLYRDNFECDSVENYFRLAIFNPFLDHFINQLEDRFIKHKNIMTTIQNILPCKVASLQENVLNDSIETILQCWDTISNEPIHIVKKEALLWKEKWVGRKERPFTFIDSLNLCDESIFPNIFKMLQIFATIPVSVASVERSFSTLKRIKTYLRNAMGESRLNGLALLSIHREINVNCEEVLSLFKEKNRKMSL